LLARSARRSTPVPPRGGRLRLSAVYRSISRIRAWASACSIGLESEMDDDDVDPFFEAEIKARAAQEQCSVALLDSQTGDVRAATAERPFVVERKSPEAARQAREKSAKFRELCRNSREFEASKLSSR
jgi:hypothetical protein